MSSLLSIVLIALLFPSSTEGRDSSPDALSVFSTKAKTFNVGLPSDLFKGVPETSPIRYHGGPVMPSATVYPIFYGRWNKTGIRDSDTLAGAALINKFLKLYGNGSARFAMNRAYGSGSNYAVKAAGTFDTASSYFVQGYVFGSTIVETNIKSIVTHAINKNGASAPQGTWKKTQGPDPNGIYLVMTSSEVTMPGGFCEVYCGWHTYGTVLATNRIKYSFVGNPANCPRACSAQQGKSPNNNVGVDAMISVIAHEIEEAVTDPLLNAWYDKYGEENADKCAWYWGPGVTMGNNGAYSNLELKDPATKSVYKFLVQCGWKVIAKGASPPVQVGCTMQ
jgi:hypothetical protein